MKNVRNLILVLVFTTCCTTIFAQASSKKIVDEITEILKKPVEKGSTARYKALKKYIDEKVSDAEAGSILADIRAKNKFGKYFYDRLSTNTVDNLIKSILSSMSGVQLTDEELLIAQNGIKLKKQISKTTATQKTEPEEGFPKVNLSDILVAFQLTIPTSWSLHLKDSKTFGNNHNYTIKEIADAMFISSDWSKHYNLTKIGPSAFELIEIEKPNTITDIIDSKIASKFKH